ncbi:MAG: acetolactate synthase small subunit [bacterium]
MKHIISVLVQRNFNALFRIIGLFSGRGFNIDSISFGEGEEPGLARVTITTEGDDQIIEQITKQLHKLVDVIKVVNLTYEPFVERELALIKVASTLSNRAEIIQVVNIFRANIIDISPKTLTIEVTGKADKVDAALGMIRAFGLLEVARTGNVALKREFQGIT